MEADIFKPLNLIFLVVKKLGLWQDGNQTWKYLVLGLVFHLFFREMYTLGVVIHAFGITNFEELVDTAGLISAMMVGLLRSWNFMSKLKHIKNIIKNLNELIEFSADERYKNRNLVRSQVEFAFKIYKFNWALALITCSIATFATVMTHQLPFKVSLPFDTNSEVGFWIAAALSVVALYTMSAIDVALNLLPVILISFTVGLMNELSNRLSCIGEKNEVPRSGNVAGKSDETTTYGVDELIKCIKIHQKIIELKQEIHQNFSKLVFLQGFMSSVILCAIVYTLSLVMLF